MTSKFNVFVKVGVEQIARTVPVLAAHSAGEAISAAVMKLDSEGIDHVTVVKVVEEKPS
jgi:hypothetical protein